MKGDFSRSTFDRKKHYSSVLLQQGRVQLDADWNEHLDIEVYLRQLRAKDIIGYNGAPRLGGGFEVAAAGNDLTLSAGRLYVDGILCENETNVRYTDQPDLPRAGEHLPNQPGLYLAYLDVWERHITALEDPHLREVALGGPETTTRIRVIWQLKLQLVNDSMTGKDLTLDWKPTGLETTGRLVAWAEANATPGNCLYRVEIHKGSDNPTGPTFKWSRDNASVVGRIETIDPAGKTITVSTIGRLPETAFATGQWVELSDEDRALRGEPGVFVQLEKVQGNELQVVEWPSTTFTPADLGPRPTVRRWDSSGGAIPLTYDNPIPLEHGVKVKFSAGTYRSGDYWTFPARVVEWPRDESDPMPQPPQRVEWPHDGSGLVPQPPQGVEHHYGQLALVEYKADQTFERKFERKEDCRFIFSSLADLKELNAVRADINAPDGAIYVDHEGRVGIGTTSPQRKLQIEESMPGGLVGLRIKNAAAVHTGWSIVHKQSTDTFGGSLQFVDDYVNSPRVILDENGRVGIGTTKPQATLDLHGNMQVHGSALIENPDATLYTTFRGKADQIYGWELDVFGSSYSGDSYGTGPNGVALVNVNNAPLALGTANQGRLHILGNGNVGIGTTTPQAKLEVAGNITAHGNVQIDGILNATELVGSVMAFAMENPPEGWLECDGQQRNSTEANGKYARLFDKIEKRFGAGSGDANSFNVPDLRGRFVRGWAHDSTNDPDRKERTASDLKASGNSGNKVGSYQDDGLQAHSHKFQGEGGTTGAENSDHSHLIADNAGGLYTPWPWQHPSPGTSKVDGLTDGSRYDTGGRSNTHGHDFTLSGTITDPTTGRVSSESRPKNVYLMYCIKY